MKDLGLEIEIKSIKDYCAYWLSTLKEKEMFTVRDIRKSWCAYVWIKRGERVLPYDDTVSRALRYLRAMGYAISYVDKNKAIWWRSNEAPKDRDEQKKLVMLYNSKKNWT